MPTNPNGARCTVCKSPARPLVDGALIAGERVIRLAATIGEGANLSRAALYRHARAGHHLPRRFVSPLDGEGVEDVVRGLVDSMRAAADVRDAATRRGADALVLRATSEVRAASVALAERLGIDDASVSTALDEASELRFLVRHAALRNPLVADELAASARQFERSDFAESAEALAALSRKDTP